MRKKLLVAFAIGLLLPAAACLRDEESGTQVRSLLESIGESSREYVYRELSKDLSVEVQGSVEDSFRNQATLLVNDIQVLNRVISDDALAVQVIAQAALPQLGAGSVADALRAGQWVIDPEGAPPVTSPSAQTPEADPIKQLDNALHVVAYLKGVANGRIVRFNPDAVGYIRSQDPFPHPDRDAGEVRFDLVPPDLPRRSEAQQLPGTAAFRRLSLYVKDGALVRVFEQISIDNHPEVKRARETGRNQTLLKNIDAVKAGQGPERVRERAMQWEILSLAKPVSVTLPTAALTGDLRALFGSAPKQANQ